MRGRYRPPRPGYRHPELRLCNIAAAPAGIDTPESYTSGTRKEAPNAAQHAMLMVLGSLVVLVGVIIGCFTIAGSGIHRRPYDKADGPGAGKLEGESPLDSPWQMSEWSRGTQSRARRR
jgi:hypothetical protein